MEALGIPAGQTETVFALQESVYSELQSVCDKHVFLTNIIQMTAVLLSGGSAKMNILENALHLYSAV